MLIQRLRDRLVTIVADFRTQTSLRQCCSALLQRDCTLLAQVWIEWFSFQRYLDVAPSLSKPCSKRADFGEDESQEVNEREFTKYHAKY